MKKRRRKMFKKLYNKINKMTPIKSTIINKNNNNIKRKKHYKWMMRLYREHDGRVYNINIHH